MYMLKGVTGNHSKFCSVCVPAHFSMLEDDLQLSDSEDSEIEQVSFVYPVAPVILLNLTFRNCLS